jgi:hypothetical protein
MILHTLENQNRNPTNGLETKRLPNKSRLTHSLHHDVTDLIDMQTKNWLHKFGSTTTTNQTINQTLTSESHWRTYGGVNENPLLSEAKCGVFVATVGTFVSRTPPAPFESHCVFKNKGTRNQLPDIGVYHCKSRCYINVSRALMDYKTGKAKQLDIREHQYKKTLEEHWRIAIQQKMPVKLMRLPANQ